MIERNFNLHLTAGHSTALVINANQFDQGEKWIFTLYNENGTQYIPSTGAIVGIKSDGLGIINSGSVVDGKVVIMETEQMTAAVGKAVFELMIDSQTHGTANFIVLVEPKPGNNADLSESDLSLLQEAIDATSPLPTGGTVGQVLTKTANGSTWSNAGTPTQEQVADAVSDWADEHITVSTGVVIDTSLSVAGAAADAKKTGDEITDLKSAVEQLGGGLSSEVKQALMNCFNYVAWKDNDPNASTYISALQSALYPPVNLSSISAVYTQSGTVYDTDSLSSLTNDLVVTAHYSDSTSEVVTAYTLSGTLTEGTSTITVSYGGKTTTFNVTVTHVQDTFYIPTSSVTLVPGYINDQGGTTSASGNYYIDEFYPADTFAYCDANGLMTSMSSGASIRIAEYDSSYTFQRRWYTAGKVNMATPASTASYVKVGWTTNYNPPYVLFLNDAESSLFTNTGKALGSNGELVTDESSATTDFVNIASSDSKYFIYSASASNTVSVAFYDSNQQFVSLDTVTESNKFADIPSGASYVRYCCNPSVGMYSPLMGVKQ